MVTAVRLMYAGAAYALIWAIGTIAVAASIVRHHPVVDDHRLSGAVTLAILVCAAEIALWLGIARACRRGISGARVAGTVLFAVHTVGVLGVLASSQAGLGPAKALTLIGWLIGLGAVVALWQRPSSIFFSARAPVAGAGRLGQRRGIVDPREVGGVSNRDHLQAAGAIAATATTTTTSSKATFVLDQLPRHGSKIMAAASSAATAAAIATRSLVR